MFRLQREPLDPQALARELQNPRAGALVAFEGWVRNHDDGRPVAGLEYQSFDAMALAKGEELLAEARRRFDVVDVLVAHRVGETVVGDRAIWVGVTSEHRQEAFLACRWIMDRIKLDVPIWKKEFFTDGRPGEWVHAGSSSLSDKEDPAEARIYSRQVLLDRLGPEGQRRLAACRVLVVGAGGLGCPALTYLAAAGVGSIVVCDGDRVDETNLHRQVLFGTMDVGHAKASVAADRLRAQNPMVSVRAVTDAATPENLPSLLDDVDLVLDCTDSFESKYAIHDAAWRAGVPLVQAAIHQFEGTVQVIDPASEAGCFRCQWPDPPAPGCVSNCEQSGVLGVTAGLLGVHQATEALKVLLGWPEALREHTLLVDVLSGRTQKLRRQKREGCGCGRGGDWQLRETNRLIPGSKAQEILAHATLVDLRDDFERTGDRPWVQQCLRVPKSEWPTMAQDLEQRPLVLCCSTGARAERVVADLGSPEGVFAWSRPIEELEKFLVTTES